MVVARRAIGQPRGGRNRLLVLAPHPDDETLGAGGLIRQSVGEGWYAGTLFLTDGGASHPDREAGARARLIRARRREARRALSCLTGRVEPLPEMLGWRDAHPFAPESVRWRATVRRVCAWCRRHRVGMIAVSSIVDTHCDHVAAAQLAREVAGQNRGAIRVLEYAIWSQRARATRASRCSRPLPAGIRRRALAAHRSQRSAVYGAGFRLPFDAGWTARADFLEKVA